MRIERFLTPTDKAFLESYRYKCNEVKNFAVACLKGTHTGLMLFGSGGNGKSYSIRETLQERGIREVTPEEIADMEQLEEMGDEELTEAAELDFGHDTWVNHQGRITPKGLVKEMARFPQSVHLVEDAETMFDDKNAWGVLRMALHSQDQSLHSKRRITWKISTKDSYDFWFSGGLIIVGNRLLNDGMEEVKAVQTRCPCVNFDIANDELVAKMKEMCEKGYKQISAAPLSKDDCYTVLEYLLTAIEEDPELKRDARGKEKKLNLRILISGFRFMALGRLEPSINWRAMLLSQLKQMVGASKRTRKERIHDEGKIADEMRGKKWTSQHDKLVEYCKRTGRPLGWADSPRESDEYKKGFNAAKTDFSRKK
jgi:hypothetical protein